MALPRPVNGIPGTDAPFDVVDMLDRPGRFEIVDKETGEIIDNANGYGYKTKTNAYKAGWFKFGGGKKKVDDAVAWWRMPEHREFSEWLLDTRSFLIDECRDMHMPLDGLRKIGQSVEHVLTPSIQGMINAVADMVKVEEI